MLDRLHQQRGVVDAAEHAAKANARSILKGDRPRACLPFLLVQSPKSKVAKSQGPEV